MELLKDLRWRYAVKKFDATKQVSDEDLQKIVEAGNLTATSLGMQTYRMVVVKDKAVIAKLAEVSWGEQLKGASCVLVLTACTNVDKKFVKNYINLAKEVRPMQEAEKLAMFEKMILGYVQGLEEKGGKEDWIARQVYIVLGTLMSACANLRIDSCPMEGIQKDKYDEILGLKEKNLTTVVSLPIGYRATDDHHQNMPKIRKSLDEMLITV